MTKDLRCAFTRNHGSIPRLIIEYCNEWQIAFLRGTNEVRLSLALFQLWHLGLITKATTVQIQSHLITELAIVERNPCDSLHHFAALGAPFVNLFELYTDESTVAELRQCANQLRTTYSKLNPFIRPSLRDQIQRGDNPSAGSFFDNGKVVWAERWMGSYEQVTRPGRDTL